MHCPIACGRHIKVTEGPYAPMDCEGPEYETIGTLGGLCLVDDLVAIAKANELCNRYGLDTISAGGIIGFAMEAYEKGILTKEDTDGVELVWGNAKTLVEMVHKIGRGEGIGQLMTEGSKRMAEALGKNAVEFAIHVLDWIRFLLAVSLPLPWRPMKRGSLPEAIRMGSSWYGAMQKRSLRWFIKWERVKELGDS